MTILDALHEYRAAEMELIAGHLPARGTILDFGAGSGHQTRQLRNLGFDVVALDLDSSNYRECRELDVIEYDGITLPFENDVFDCVFSSNVLEHVKDLPRVHDEISRVLKPGGYCVHILPTHIWRLWSSVAILPAALKHLVTGRFRRAAGAIYHGIRLTPHGERGNAFDELTLFHPSWWRRNFTTNGYEIVQDKPLDIWYSGEVVLGPLLGRATRRKIAGVLGSSTHLFVIRKQGR